MEDSFGAFLLRAIARLTPAPPRGTARVPRLAAGDETCPGSSVIAPTGSYRSCLAHSLNWGTRTKAANFSESSRQARNVEDRRRPQPAHRRVGRVDRAAILALY